MTTFCNFAIEKSMLIFLCVDNISLLIIFLYYHNWTTWVLLGYSIQIDKIFCNVRIFKEKCDFLVGGSTIYDISYFYNLKLETKPKELRLSKFLLNYIFIFHISITMSFSQLPWKRFKLLLKLRQSKEDFQNVLFSHFENYTKKVVKRYFFSFPKILLGFSQLLFRGYLFNPICTWILN